jgi:hypothetical protein
LIEGDAQRQYKANSLFLTRRALEFANVAFVLYVLSDKSQDCGLHLSHEPSTVGYTREPFKRSHSLQRLYITSTFDQ